MPPKVAGKAATTTAAKKPAQADKKPITGKKDANPSKAPGSKPAKTLAAPAAPAKTAEAAKAPEAPEKRKIIAQKQIAAVLIEDENREIRDHGKAVLVIDNENQIAARFLPYSGANVLEAMDPKHVEPERMRNAIIGAVRFGKPLALNLGECGPDMLDVIETKVNEIQPGLWQKVLNRDICKREHYESIVKDTDDDSYRVATYYDFEGDISAKYMLLIVMKPDVYPPSFTKQFYTVTIEQQ